MTLGAIRRACDPQPMKVQSVTLKGRISLAMNLSGGQRRRLREEERGRAKRYGRVEGLSSECDAAAEASPGTKRLPLAGRAAGETAPTSRQRDAQLSSISISRAAAIRQD